MTLPSNEMQPRYKSGDILFIDPNLYATYEDDLVIVLNFEKKVLMIVREVASMEVINPEAKSDEETSVIYDTIVPKDRDENGLWDDSAVVTFLEGNQSKERKTGFETPFEKLSLPRNLGKLTDINVHVCIGSYRQRTDVGTKLINSSRGIKTD